ncbi:MAG: hypothetical protein IR153_03770 [Flavobacterium sp.]|nr:hypothetical protein [Flavobacterium sp.]
MKAIVLIMLAIFAKGCEDQVRDMEATVIEYSANTRGFYQKITIANKVAQVTNDREGIQPAQQVQISDSDWKALVDAFSKVDLNKLSELKAPSEKRAFDGAAHAGLRVRYKDTNYETTNFDHGNPPAEISDFVEKIVVFGKPKDGN